MIKINSSTTIQPNFKAKVSPKFINFIHDYINRGPNRLQNNYKLNAKLEEYKNFGYEDYTINLINKAGRYGQTYSLVAVKDGDTIENGIFMNKKDSFGKILWEFLNIRKGEFKAFMRRNRKYDANL